MSVISAATRSDLRRVSRQTGLAVAFLFIVANSAFALLMFREVRQASAWVAHTQDAILTLQDVRELIRQAGSGQRGYLFTGDRKFLTIYEQAEGDLSATVRRLSNLVADDPDQSGRIASLAARIAEDQNRLASSIVLEPPGSGRHPSANDLTANRLETEALVGSVGPIIAEERRLLQARISAVEQRNGLSLLLVSVGTVVSLMVIAVMLYLLHGEVRARSTELAGADAALRESEQRFRRVFEESPLGILLAESGSERIVQANPAICAMLDYESDELIGKAIAEIAHVDDRDLLVDASRTTTQPGQLIETRYLTRAGIVTWVRVRITQLSTSNRREALLLYLVEDTTQQKLVEAELRQAQKMEAIGQLTGGIAHDFNNLLGVIIGNAEFLIDAVHTNPDHNDLAQEILRSALSGADLTRRLLAFARRQTLQPRQIDLNAYLPDHIAMLRRLLGETIQITPKFADDLWPIRADPSQVGDALLNLAINARDAMPLGGRITIETANVQVDTGTAAEDGGMAPGDYIVLAVTDTGSGIAPALLDRVVEPFFTTKASGAGSGLGLSMTYGFARQSGGHLRIASKVGHGTTVRLYLPRALGEDADDHGRADEPSLPGGDESILLVDDNPELRAVGRRHLISLGYRVTEAESGPAALALLRGQDHYDLLFTDVAMPHGMSGYQLAASARLLLPSIKVLFTTGYSGTGTTTKTEPVRPSPGATIGKPYRKGELAITVRAALEA